jgi:CheY-like chemotaxis protein
VISAQDNPGEELKTGEIGYLTKPVTFDKLEEVLNTIKARIAKTMKKLLVVEDEDVMRLSIQKLLSRDEVMITAAESGQEAYELLKAEEFDCLILDLGLTDISGFDFLEQIAEDEAIAQLPIIVYTGKELTKDEEVRLKQHTETIIIKGERSPERLLDEVTLFLHQVHAKLPEMLRKKVRMLHDKEGVLQGKQVLLVDDDMRNVYALLSVLRGKGMDVMVGENGKEALKVLAKTPNVDLVLMDIMMPELDGYETMRQIREQAQFKDLPIIALTAKAMRGDRRRCIEAGANDYLSKPIDVDKLLSLLRVWLY